MQSWIDGSGVSCRTAAVDLVHRGGVLDVRSFGHLAWAQVRNAAEDRVWSARLRLRLRGRERDIGVAHDR
jgi:hypothetical protein